jgi:hypothetical protein
VGRKRANRTWMVAVKAPHHVQGISAHLDRYTSGNARKPCSITIAFSEPLITQPDLNQFTRYVA